MNRLTTIPLDLRTPSYTDCSDAAQANIPEMWEREFWRWVMYQAADRGIRVYFFTSNVFTFGAEGKHGITNDLGNEITKKYFRASVREMGKTRTCRATVSVETHLQYGQEYKRSRG